MAENPNIIIKKYKKSHHASHGGAWKIAYADFVTAMMAFFLLMWLVSAASEETKKGVAEYFTASVITAKAASVGAGILGGEISAVQSGNIEIELDKEDDKYVSHNSSVPNSKEQLNHEKQMFPNDFGSNTTGVKKDITKNIEVKEHSENIISQEKMNKNEMTAHLSKAAEISNKKMINEDKNKENKNYELIKKTMNKIKSAFKSSVNIEKLKNNLDIELTNEGLKIQIIDSPDREMFKIGSANPEKHTEDIIKHVAKIIYELPNKINISGHTDSYPYNKKNYGNWELSSDRANETRRILEKCGIGSDRFMEVNGRADRDPFNKKNTKAPENRRISITVLYSDSQKTEQENTENNSVNTEENEAELL